MAASWASALAPTLGFTSLGVMASVLTRRSVAGIGVPLVAGLAMQLGSLINGADLIRILLLTTPLGTPHRSRSRQRGHPGPGPYGRPSVLG